MWLGLEFRTRIPVTVRVRQMMLVFPFTIYDLGVKKMWLSNLYFFSLQLEGGFTIVLLVMRESK